MKKNSKGFMLAETLIVTTFVSGILVFLLIQLITLNANYEYSYKYNTVENLYSLRNIVDYIKSDDDAIERIEEKIVDVGYLELTDCFFFTEQDYCLKLFESEHISNLFITDNYIDKDLFFNYDDEFKKFVSKINGEGSQKYRIVAIFNDSKYATIRIGD